jgi:hypothetical protein
VLLQLLLSAASIVLETNDSAAMVALYWRPMTVQPAAGMLQRSVLCVCLMWCFYHLSFNDRVCATDDCDTCMVPVPALAAEIAELLVTSPPKAVSWYMNHLVTRHVFQCHTSFLHCLHLQPQLERVATFSHHPSTSVVQLCTAPDSPRQISTVTPLCHLLRAVGKT